MTQELVSIVTPAYNASRFLEATVRSAIAQTYRQWEMLVVDDCSIDATAQVLARLAAEDPRVRPIAHERNGGPARARNTALRAARGGLVAFLDSDDLWLPQKLERQVSYLREVAGCFCFTGFRRIDESGERVGRFRPLPRRLAYRDLLKNTAIMTSTVLIDRRVTGDFTMPVTYYDDFAAWLGILRRGHIAHGLLEDLVRYRVVGRSISRNKGRSALWVWKTYREVERLSLPTAAWCFANYAWRGYLKYRSL